MYITSSIKCWIYTLSFGSRICFTTQDCVTFKYCCLKRSLPDWVLACHMVRSWFLQSKSTIIIVPLTKLLSMIAGVRQIEHLCRSWVRQDLNTKNTVPSEIGLVFLASSKDSKIFTFRTIARGIVIWVQITFIFLNIGFIIPFSGDIFWRSFHDYIFLRGKGNICINWCFGGILTNVGLTAGFFGMLW